MPVFEGQYKVASDPAIIRDNDIYRMFMTGLDTENLRTIICQAVSSDGISWKYIDYKKPWNGLVLSGTTGTWYENAEANYVLKWAGEYWIYFSGYKDKGTPLKGFPASLGLIRSSDGVNFSLFSDQPILTPTKGWYDNDAVYSPTIIREQNQFIMIYTGHCYTDSSLISSPGVYLLAAVSVDGIHWEKRKEPVMEPVQPIDWMREGGAEASLVKGPDGMFYLFFTGLKAEERVLGVGRSDSPFGPWDINPNPIIWPQKTEYTDEYQVLAPHVMIEGGKVRMWHMIVNQEEHISIGYAEASWPLYRDDNEALPPSKLRIIE